MTEKRTIAEAARLALAGIGRPAGIGEIYHQITSQGLYQFNTPTPEHVLRTTIRRHTGNVERIDSSEVIIFDMVAEEVYGLITWATNGRSAKGLRGMKRIHRASDKEEIIKLLMADHVGIFKEIWRLLLFAAQVGIRVNKREPLGSFESGKGIDQSTFGNSPVWPGILYLTAIVESGQSEVLGGAPEREDERIRIFQEYANGGLSILRDFFSDRRIDLDGVLAFLETQRAEEKNSPDLDLSI